MKVKKHGKWWPSQYGGYCIADSRGLRVAWISGHLFGDQAEQVAERVLAAINGEALDALPQTERVLVTKLIGRVPPGHESPVSSFGGHKGGWSCRLESGRFVDILPDDDGMVEVLTEDAS